MRSPWRCWAAGWAGIMEVLGSDYPFDMASTDPVAGVEAVGLGDDERSMVLDENANRFLRPLDQDDR